MLKDIFTKLFGNKKRFKLQDFQRNRLYLYLFILKGVVTLGKIWNSKYFAFTRGTTLMISYAAVTLSKLCNNKLAILDSGVEGSSS